MNYATSNGDQVRNAGGGGDGRAMMALQQRCAWASFLTRNGERVDPRDITDLTQLAKDLSNAPTPELPPVADWNYPRFRFASIDLAAADTSDQYATDLWQQVAGRFVRARGEGAGR